MGPGDLFAAAAILAAAGWLLHRSLFRRRGGCHGCASRECGSRPPEVVRLGPPPRSGRDEDRPGTARV
jgi:hypothetical protein